MATPKKPTRAPNTVAGKPGGPELRTFGRTGRAVLVPKTKVGYRTYEDGSQVKRTAPEPKRAPTPPKKKAR